MYSQSLGQGRDSEDSCGVASEPVIGVGGWTPPPSPPLLSPPTSSVACEEMGGGTKAIKFPAPCYVTTSV